MAWTYEASGDGSDTRKIAAMINAHNVPYQWRRDSTDGITARETYINTQFGQSLGKTNNNFLARLQGAVDVDRLGLNQDQSVYYNIFQDYLTTRAKEEFNVTGLRNAADELILDMYSNSKTFEPSVASVAQGTKTHIVRSTIHAHASALNFLSGGSTVQTVEKVSDLATETMTFEVDVQQTTAGVTRFNVYGESASETQDVAGGFGPQGNFSTRGWESGGILAQPNARDAGTSPEPVQQWRCFDAISSSRFTSAPVTGLVTRNTTAGEPYWGSSDFKWIGDDTNATLYLAQRIGNPLRNLNTTAWGTTVNNTAEVKAGWISASEKVLICTFFYKGVPTGHTLTPEILAGGNTRTADQTIIAVQSDGSSTWRKAAFAFYVRAGDTDADAVFALNLTTGAGTLSSSLDVQIQRICLEAPTRIGNVWYAGQPSITPLAAGAKDTFTLTQTSEGNFQKFFTKLNGPSTQANRSFRLADVNGQAYQFPSDASETESDSLITIADK